MKKTNKQNHNYICNYSYIYLSIYGYIRLFIRMHVAAPYSRARLAMLPLLVTFRAARGSPHTETTPSPHRFPAKQTALLHFRAHLKDVKKGQLPLPRPWLDPAAELGRAGTGLLRAAEGRGAARAMLQRSQQRPVPWARSCFLLTATGICWETWELSFSSYWLFRIFIVPDFRPFVFS